MKLNSFEYVKCESLKEASEFLLKHDPKAKVLAGGTDVVVGIREGFFKPEYVVDIKPIADLKTLSYNKNEGLSIGATVTLNEIANSEIVQKNYPVLAEGAHVIGSLQVRHRATLVGNICNASPLADTAPALLLYKAQVVIFGPDGEKKVSVEDFFIGPKETILKPGEIVTKVIVPPQNDAIGTYIKHARRKAVDLAGVGVGVLIIGKNGKKVDEVRIALGAVAPTPVRAKTAENLLKGAEITSELLDKVKEAVTKDISPISDVRASEEYRLEISKVLTRRAIAELMEIE